MFVLQDVPSKNDTHININKRYIFVMTVWCF